MIPAGVPPVGATVKVVKAIGETERTLMDKGSLFTVARYAEPHGFAVIADDHGVGYHVHPEALEVVPLRAA